MAEGPRAGACRIALDAMGGDHAPDEIIKGALLAAAESPVDILLVGKQEVLAEKLKQFGDGSTPRIEIVDAREVVERDDAALAPIRKKRNSSVRVCANLVKEGRAQAMVSAGHTGAAMTSAYMVLGTIEGVSRPALAARNSSIGSVRSPPPPGSTSATSARASRPATIRRPRGAPQPR